jgi:hypothetical protein
VLLVVNVDYAVVGCDDEDYLDFAEQNVPISLDWSCIVDLKGDTYSSLEETASLLALTNDEFVEMLERDVSRKLLLFSR